MDRIREYFLMKYLEDISRKTFLVIFLHFPHHVELKFYQQIFPGPMLEQPIEILLSKISAQNLPPALNRLPELLKRHRRLPLLYQHHSKSHMV